MSTEVELKFLVSSDEVPQRINQLFAEHQIPFIAEEKQLGNCYFDTAELALRKLDFGLRVRTVNGKNEQTIKTAGVVVGGLHQRPEYNIDITESFPKLSLFPQNIWPAHSDVEQLQQQLISLFNTDFHRHTWLLDFQQSKIELAYDNGQISSKGQNVAINEVELELVSGKSSDLLALARLLVSCLALRPGSQSKAARGYRLYHQRDEFFEHQLLLGEQAQIESVAKLFCHGVGHYLAQLQTCVSHYLVTREFQQLAQLVDVLSLLRHGFWLFETCLSEQAQAIRQELSHFIQQLSWVDNAIYRQELMNKTGNYRKKLDYSEQLISSLKLENRRLPEEEAIVEFLHSERFNSLQLELLAIVVEPERYVNSANFSGDLKTFAQQKLDENLALLTDALSQLTDEDVDALLEHRKLLHRCLLTGNWFGFMFSSEQREQFRVPWLDMQQGLRELQSLWIIKKQLEKLDLDDDSNAQKIIAWQHRKVENLLLALSHTKNAAMESRGYWLI